MRVPNAFALLCAIPAVHGWGELGHRTVAYLAEKYLSSAASDLVDNLLANNRGWDISDGALWADAVKHRRGYNHTGKWHYIDAADDPPRYCNVNYRRDCKPGPGCIVSAISNFTARVNDASLAQKQQKEALMFLLHFIGDIHQPLHTELLDRGGNDIHVNFSNRVENLHAVWDTHIAHKMRGLKAKEGDDAVLKEAAAVWAEELYAANEATVAVAECRDVSTAEKCALEWAEEGNAWICDNVLKPGVEWLKDRRNDLAGEYFDDAVPVVDELVAKAGLRLGAWLNALAAGRECAGFVVQEGERIEI